MNDARKYIIVGLDPGTNFGIAAINFDGEVLYCKSIKNCSIEDVIRVIRNLGIPTVICTDKPTAPELVKNVASILKVPIFCPPKDFSFEEKNSVVKGFENLPSYSVQFDEHQIVALFAAIKAFKRFKNDFKVIDSLVDNLVFELNNNLRNSIKLDLLSGVPPKRSLYNYIKQLLKGYNIESYSSNIVFSKQVSSMNEELSRLRKKVRTLESLLSKVSSEKNAQKVKKINETTLKFVYDNEKKERVVEASKLFSNDQNYFKVIPLEKASAKNVKLLLSSVGENRKNSAIVVYMNKIEGDPSKIAKVLNKFGIKYAILNSYKEEFSEVFTENGVALFPSTNVVLVEENGSYYLSKSKLLELQKELQP